MFVNIDNPWFSDPVSERQFAGEYWDTVEFTWILWSGIIAAAMNLLFLIIIPCSFGGMDKDVKYKQFMSGFVLNLILGAGLPVFYRFAYGLDNVTMWELFFFYIVAFPVTLIVGSRFVTKDYRKAFWFW